jgi:membrane associated rhomboid family serine protease
MDSFFGPRDGQPLTWWGRVPVYATTWLVVVHSAAFLLVALANPLGYSGLIPALVFSTEGVLGHFQVWQIITYAFVPQIGLWFLIEMLMLYFFGQEVEKFLGRQMFLTLYAILVLVPPFFLIFAGIFGHSSVLAGAGAPHFAIFVAFAAIAPGALLLFGIAAKWFAIGFFVFNSVVLLSALDWTRLSALWLDVAATILFLRGCGVRSLQWRWAEGPSRRRAIPRMQMQPRESKSKVRITPRDPVDAIDPILEKISSQGLHSLTPAERARLEKARAALLQKEDDT